MSKYKPFIHVEHLDRDEAEGILQGDCFITPKLDGTNAVVFYKDGELHAGSRTRELFPDQSDNADFRKWLSEDGLEVQLIRRFLERYPNYILYGEWLGYNKFIGNIKDYNKAALKTFHIFDIYDTEKEEYLHPTKYYDILTEYCLINYTVPLLVIATNPTQKQIENIAECNSYLLDNVGHPGEGIVIRNPNFKNKYGRYVIAKYVRPEYKQSKHRQVPEDSDQIESIIVSKYVVDTEISKAIAKTNLHFNLEKFAPNKSTMGYLLNEVWRGVICDEIANILKKYKNPTINFSLLRKYCDKKVREYLKL